MGFRGKSIRRKIVALLLVPLVSLAAIWAFATVLTGQEASQLFGVARVVDKVGYPVEDTARVLQEERRRTLVYLADPRASDALTGLRRSRSATDAVVARLRANAVDADVKDDLGHGATERLSGLLEDLDGISSLRTSVEEGTVTRATALSQYNKLVDPCYALLTTLPGVDDVGMSRQMLGLVGVARARELLSQEDALLGSALVAQRVTMSEIHQISDLMAQRDLLYDENLPLLPRDERDRFTRYWSGTGTTALRAAERAVVASDAGTPSGVTAPRWNDMAGKVLDELADRDSAAQDRYQDRAQPVAVAIVIRAAVVGVLGLLAVLFSLYLSVRIGRGLVRDLRRLRLEAHEASGVRLPGVMRRLAAGEEVDVETEAPRLEYGKDEIGQVGLALNTLQRAAVEAAVKQARLRHGVSDVFVNLARRSQVLLHKQLTLLDSMERRTEDTDELADLFRLDHLTTRMRRHAEGLVILSGAAPSRQWRKPVQLMDVVRASVAEVEDYERIEVRRLPRIAVQGPAVADLTHLIAELLENATVFSPPHTAVQVVGERVANGFTLEIHDRGLGLTADALLDANLRLSETTEFELSDTDRLGLFVVSRLAQRQRVRVSLQPSPYGGTTAVVFVPDALLTEAIDTDGTGFRVDGSFDGPGSLGRGTGERAPALIRASAGRAPLDGPVELEAPVGTPGLDTGAFPGLLGDEAVGSAAPGGSAGNGERPRRTAEAAGIDDAKNAEDAENAKNAENAGAGGPFRHRRRSPAEVPAEQHQQARDAGEPQDTGRTGQDAQGRTALPRRGTPKLVSSHGKPVAHSGPRDTREPAAGRTPLPTGEQEAAGGLPGRRRGPAADAPAGGETDAGGEADAAPVLEGLPRRVRQASLAPQLRGGPDRRGGREARPGTARPVERDADEVRSRMSSLQRGWQRGREENAEGDTSPGSTAQGTTSEGDGR